MSYKKYMLFRLLGVIFIAALGAWASITDKFVLLIPVAVITLIVLLTLKKRVKETVVDERVNAVAYRASRIAFVTFALLAVITGIILINLAEDASDALFQVGLTLNYSACTLMLFYWGAYFYYNRKLGGK